MTLIIRKLLASLEETDFIKALPDSNRPAYAVIDVVERVTDMIRGKLTTRYVKVNLNMEFVFHALQLHYETLVPHFGLCKTKTKPIIFVHERLFIVLIYMIQKY